MTTPDPSIASQDPRVQAAIGEYLDRIDRGETVDREQFLAGHPDIADALRSFIATAESLEQIARPERDLSPAFSRATASVAGGETIPPVRTETTPDPHALPAEFGRYRIKKPLGRGAMGAVYLAHDTELDRLVAIKTPTLADDPTGELLERFRREARSAARLRHANICPLFDVGTIDGRHYLSMAYIEGRPLSAFIQPEKLPSQRQSLAVVRKLALALQAAHDEGIVHRDLKPANIMIDRKGEPIIMDFGLARLTGRPDGARLTQSGMIVGSPAYMSPEQVEADPDRVGPASDQYSLGVILYELLTGQLPFQGTIAATIAAILTRDPPPLLDLRPDIDPRIATLCARMMAKSPADRFPSLKEAAAEMAVLQKSLPSSKAATAGPAADAGGSEKFPATQGSLVGLMSAVRTLRTSLASPSASAPSAATIPGRSSRKRTLAAILAIGAALLLGVVIVVKTRNGDIRVEVDDPNAIVRIETQGSKKIVPAPSQPLRDARAAPADDEWTLPVWIEVPPGLAPPLDEATITKTETRLLEELKSTQEPGKSIDRAALATEWIKTAGEPWVKPDERYVRLQIAARLAAEATQYETSLEAIDELAKWYELDIIKRKFDVLTENMRFADKPDAWERLTWALLRTGFETIEREDYRLFPELAALGKAAAEHTNAPDLVWQSEFLAREAENGERGYRQIQLHAETLRTAPEDPTANLHVGRYLCLTKNDWTRGLPMLANGNDGDWRRIAEDEQQGPKDSKEQVKLADAWWALGEKADAEPFRLPVRRRARLWYLRGMQPLKGDERADLVDRIWQRLAQVSTEPAYLRIRTHVDWAYWTYDGDSILASYKFGPAQTLRLTHLPLPPRHRTPLPNAGASRLLPEAVDFSSARIATWRSGRWSDGHYARSERQMTAALTHAPRGSGSYDVTFRFSDEHNPWTRPPIRLKSGEWTNVLHLVDPARHTVWGNDWRREGADLVSSTEPHARLTIPLRVEGNYALRVEFTRVQGKDDVNTHLPVMDTSALVQLCAYDGATSGLSLIRRKGADKNESGVKNAPLENGRRYRLEVAVAVNVPQVTVTVTLDGAPHFQWEGPIRDLDMKNGWDEWVYAPIDRSWWLPDARTLGLGTFSSSVRFHKVELKLEPGATATQLY